jgi:ribonuclease HII
MKSGVALVGAVVTAAVILDPAKPIVGLNDSKNSAKSAVWRCSMRLKRKRWLEPGRAEPHEIDELNILHATMLAMQRAVAGLKIVPEFVLIDGNRCPALPMPSWRWSKATAGWQKSAQRLFWQKSRATPKWPRWTSFPQYGFAQHKGYPTAFIWKSC